MIAGEPTFSGNGSGYALAAYNNVFSGKTAYRITLSDLVHRCRYNMMAIRGVTVVDSRSQSVMHWADGGGVSHALEGYLQGVYAGALGFRRFFITCDNRLARSSGWNIADDSNRSLRAVVVPPGHINSSSPLLDQILASKFAPKVKSWDLHGCLAAVESAIDLCQENQVALVWTMFLDEVNHYIRLFVANWQEQPLFNIISNPGLGNSELLGLWQFTARLE